MFWTTWQNEFTDYIMWKFSKASTTCWNACQSDCTWSTKDFHLDLILCNTALSSKYFTTNEHQCTHICSLSVL